MGGFIGQNVTVTPELRRRFVVAYEIINTYAPAWIGQFQNFYLVAPDNVGIQYWPAANWFAEAPAEMDINKEEWFYIGDVEHNSERKTVWTGSFYDSVSKDWYITCITPIVLRLAHIICSFAI